MTLTGICYAENRIVDTSTVTVDDGAMSFRQQLEAGLLELCRQLRLTTPIWMKKNTVQLAAIAAVTFERDQFIDGAEMRIDRFEVRLERH